METKEPCWGSPLSRPTKCPHDANHVLGGRRTRAEERGGDPYPLVSCGKIHQRPTFFLQIYLHYSNKHNIHIRRPTNISAKTIPAFVDSVPTPSFRLLLTRFTSLPPPSRAFPLPATRWSKAEKGEERRTFDAEEGKGKGGQQVPLLLPHSIFAFAAQQSL